MAVSKRLLVSMLGLMLSFCLVLETGVSVQAAEGEKNYFSSINSGVSAILDPGVKNSTEVINATVQELSLTQEQEAQSTLVMANVQNALNVRAEANEESVKVGKLYKDCGGTILERKDGWTKLQSGNVIGWASDEYLLFDQEAEALANNVGKLVATINTDALRARYEASTESAVYGVLPKGEIVDVVKQDAGDWVVIDYEGADAYVSAEYVDVDFKIDAGETIEEIKAREAAEKEAKRHVNYGEFTTDADTTMLLAALIQCEAGGESYEGQLAVGAVVMNRVRSAAYPDSIHGVIYASGQFTPAASGKVNRLYESGKIKESCIKAAAEAISGVSNVGSITHFRRNDGRDGIVIGNHVFY